VKTLGEVLKKAREDAGLSIRDLSRMTGMATGQLSEIENGIRKDPGFSTIERLAQALRISLDALAAALRDRRADVKSALEPSALERLAMLQKAEAAQKTIGELIIQLEAALESPTIAKKSSQRKKP
jgi:transcriptional regulator with XRE-family HTH domain